MHKIYMTETAKLMSKIENLMHGEVWQTNKKKTLCQRLLMWMDLCEQQNSWEQNIIVYLLDRYLKDRFLLLIACYILHLRH